VHPFLPFFLSFDNGGLGQVRSFFRFGAICSDSAGKSVRIPAGLCGLGRFCIRALGRLVILTECAGAVGINVTVYLTFSSFLFLKFSLFNLSSPISRS